MDDIKIGVGCGVRNGFSLQVLEEALRRGIRYFDTSTFYAVGALADLDGVLARMGIDRNDVHISLKLWMTDLGKTRTNDYAAAGLSLWQKYEECRRMFNNIRFDSIVIHNPLKVDEEGIPEEFIAAEVWPQLEQLVTVGAVKGIGVSNFNIVELHRLLETCRIPPVSAQIEFNPYARNQDYVDFCRRKGIKVIGHSPFGFGWTDGHLALFADSVIAGLAEKHAVPPARVILAWIVAKGVAPIPGTTNPAHVEDFAGALTLALPPEDIAAIDGLNRNKYNYLGIFDYFRAGHHRKYFAADRDLHALIYNDQNAFEKVSIFDDDFMARVKHGLTQGAGFVVVPGIWADTCRRLQETLAAKGLTTAGRFNGSGPNLSSILNSGEEILELVDDPVASLIIESLLGWDCKLDNISLSTSRIAPDNAIFGPHQDSPFDNNPGAPLPPPDYPLVLQIIVAVDEFTETNGPLYVIPHSHKKQQRVIVPWQGGMNFGTLPETQMKCIVPKGSAIIAVGHIWHGTHSNVSDAPRMGLLMEFVVSVCDARDKFTVNTVTPELIEKGSRRVVRLLNNGKLHQHDTPAMLNAFKDQRRPLVQEFAKKK